MTPTTTVLALEHLTVSYPQPGRPPLRAVADASLDVAAGLVHAIIGESGSGKSTVAAAVAGLLPPTATTSGCAALRTPERNVELLEHWRQVGRATRWASGRGDPLRGHAIGVVPQSTATFLTPVRTLYSQLRETCDVLGSGANPYVLLEQVGLDSAALHRYPHELSGGMAQRAAVAFALAGRPRLLIADEPTSALDDDRARVILDLLRTFADSGGAVLLVTHDIARLTQGGHSDLVSVMRAGRLLETGVADAVLHNPTHPYTQALLAALPERGLHPIPVAVTEEHSC